MCDWNTSLIGLLYSTLTSAPAAHVRGRSCAITSDHPCTHSQTESQTTATCRLK